MLSFDDINTYYSRPDVQSEIVKYSKNRWVGIHCSIQDKAGRPVLLRYTRRRRTPLTISRQQDIPELMTTFRALGPRVIYATANVYRRLEHYEDVTDLTNVVACMPTWDVDNNLDDWRITIGVAKSIVSFLHDGGVKKSVFVKWSGNGCHIHIHHKAISEQLSSKILPLDLAYAAVRHTILSLDKEIHELTGKNRLPKVENNMDPQRLFTAPLSLHRSLDVACVCIDPDDLEKFEPDWLRTDHLRHFSGWDRYVEGEADAFCERAYLAVGPR